MPIAKIQGRGQPHNEGRESQLLWRYVMDVIFITLYSPKHTHTHTIFSLGAVHTSPRSYLEMFICELIIEVRVLSLSLLILSLSHTQSP